jgi:hypothetical protein
VKKSEWHRYWTERMHVGPSPQPRVAGPTPPEPHAHNESTRAGKKATYAYEATTGRPSRKSSRKGANRQKNDVQFRNKQRTSESRPAPER